MTWIQATLIVIGIVNFGMAISNRFANYSNYNKLKEILIEEKIQSKERSKNGKEETN